MSPMGSPAQYLAKFNNLTLPGYVQQETFDSQLNIVDHYAAFQDGSPGSEDTGLANKQLTLVLKVWEQNYLTVKDQTQLAATIVRSSKNFAPLYIMYSDKHYEALTKSITYDKSVPSSVKIATYTVQFECKPWLVGEDLKVITGGPGTINTDQVSRVIADGGWTPTIVTMTGTNMTVSGYTAAGDFTGFISVSGAVTNLVVDTEAFTATIGGINRNDLLKSVDYRLYTGPEKTYFAVTGGSIVVDYFNRWDL